MGSFKMLRSILGPPAATSRFAQEVLIACLMIGALGVPGVNAAGEKELLAPSGHLRIGVYAGSPTSMVTDAGTGQKHGLTYDLGRELAARLPTEYVTFPRIADVVDAMKQGQIDFTVTNATPARANVVSFSEPLLAIELGYLVPSNSSISSADQMDRSEIRIGVTKGGTSDRVLSAKFKNATIIAADSVKLAIELLRRGELDAYATKGHSVRNVRCTSGRPDSGWQLGTGAHGHRHSQGARASLAIRWRICAGSAGQRAGGADSAASGIKGRCQAEALAFGRRLLTWHSPARAGATNPRASAAQWPSSK
jgi:polar amino acid transport system substrate-binding protein